MSAPLAPLVPALEDASRRGTGYLHVTSGDSHADVYFADGLVYAAHVEGFTPMLGRRLLSNGCLTPEQYQSLLTRNGGDEYDHTLGLQSVKAGYFRQDVLEDALTDVLVASFCVLISWTEPVAKYRRRGRTSKLVAPPMPATALLHAARRRRDHWDTAWSQTGYPAPEVTYPLALGSPVGNEDPTVQAVLAFCNGVRNLDQIAHACGLTRYEAGHALADLMRQGKATLASPPAAVVRKPNTDSTDDTPVFPVLGPYVAPDLLPPPEKDATMTTPDHTDTDAPDTDATDTARPSEVVDRPDGTDLAEGDPADLIPSVVEVIGFTSGPTPLPDDIPSVADPVPAHVAPPVNHVDGDQPVAGPATHHDNGLPEVPLPPIPGFDGPVPSLPVLPTQAPDLPQADEEAEPALTDANPAADPDVTPDVSEADTEPSFLDAVEDPRQAAERSLLAQELAAASDIARVAEATINRLTVEEHAHHEAVEQSREYVARHEAFLSAAQADATRLAEEVAQSEAEKNSLAQAQEALIVRADDLTAVARAAQERATEATAALERARAEHETAMADLAQAEEAAAEVAEQTLGLTHAQEANEANAQRMVEDATTVQARAAAYAVEIEQAAQMIEELTAAAESCVRMKQAAEQRLAAIHAVITDKEARLANL